MCARIPASPARRASSKGAIPRLPLPAVTDATRCHILLGARVSAPAVASCSAATSELPLEVSYACAIKAEVEADVKRALTLLEPALILGMGGLLAIIIMGILMGILSVNTMAF